MIFNQLERNIHFYKKELDVLKVDGKLFYIIYFPTEMERI